MYLIRLVFIFLLCLISLSQHSKTSFTVTEASVQVRGDNLDLHVYEGGSQWWFSSSFGLSVLANDGHGNLFAYCMGGCVLKGEINAPQTLFVEQDRGNIYLEDIKRSSVKLNKGRVASSGVGNLSVMLHHGEIDSYVPDGGRLIVSGAHLDGHVYLSSPGFIRYSKNGWIKQEKQYKAQGKVIVNHIEGEVKITSDVYSME